MNDHSKGTTSFGFGIRTEDLGRLRFCIYLLELECWIMFVLLAMLLITQMPMKCSYQRSDPNYIMLTPNMEHSAQGVGEQPVFHAHSDSGSYDHLPPDLRPIDRIM